MSKLGNIDMAWKNRVKVIRSAVRLKYSIEADNRLNEIIDEEYKAFYKKVQQGVLPAAFDPETVLVRK